jgi:hypothetical protein
MDKKDKVSTSSGKNGVTFTTFVHKIYLEIFVTLNSFSLMIANEN